jgi:hypothetical protein
LIAAFVLWEAYWVYVFLSAPIPDERMDTIVAMLMAIFIPLLLLLALALFMGVRKLVRHKPVEKPE